MSIGEWHRSDKQNNDEVICPNCAHQFRAIPVNVQSDLARVTAELAACKEDAARKAIQTLIALIDAAGGEVTIYASRYVCLPVTLTLTVEQTIDGNVVYRTRDAAIKEGS